MWLYLCLSSTIISGLIPIAMKKCSLDKDSKTISILGLFIINCGNIIISILAEPNILKNFNFLDLIRILPLSLCYILASLCSVWALKFSSVSTTSPIKKGNAVLTLFLGIIILKEHWTILSLIASLTLIALTMLIAKGSTSKEKSDIRGILAAYLFVFSSGFYGFLNKIYIQTYQSPMQMIFYYGLSIVLLLLIYCLTTRNWNYFNIKKIDTKKFFIIYSILSIASSLLNKFSLIDGQASTVAVIQASSIVITILMSRYFLKEKISFKKYIMILGIFICVVILSLC